MLLLDVSHSDTFAHDSVFSPGADMERDGGGSSLCDSCGLEAWKGDERYAEASATMGEGEGLSALGEEEELLLLRTMDEGREADGESMLCGASNASDGRSTRGWLPCLEDVRDCVTSEVVRRKCSPSTRAL